VGWMLAVMIAWPLSVVLNALIGRFTFKSGVSFLFEPIGLLIWLLFSIGLSAIASFLPAWRASRRPIRGALEYE
jgi:ABC-type lipoprotein release transport system permease subunit